MHLLSALWQLTDSFFPFFDSRRSSGLFLPFWQLLSCPLWATCLTGVGASPRGRDVVLMVTEWERSPPASDLVSPPPKKMQMVQNMRIMLAVCVCVCLNVHFSDSYYHLSLTSASCRLPWKPPPPRLQPSRRWCLADTDGDRWSVSW